MLPRVLYIIYTLKCVQCDRQQFRKIIIKLLKQK